MQAITSHSDVRLLKFLPAWTDGTFPDYLFLDRMAMVFVFFVLLIIAISLFVSYLFRQQ